MEHARFAGHFPGTAVPGVRGRLAILTSATLDRNSSLFTLSTTQLAEWYGVSDSTSVATPVTTGTWGQVKAKYRR